MNCEDPKYGFELRRSPRLGGKIAKCWNRELRRGQRHKCHVCGAICNDGVDLARHNAKHHPRAPEKRPAVIILAPPPVSDLVDSPLEFGTAAAEGF